MKITLTTVAVVGVVAGLGVGLIGILGGGGFTPPVITKFTTHVFTTNDVPASVWASGYKTNNQTVCATNYPSLTYTEFNYTNATFYQHSCFPSYEELTQGEDGWPQNGATYRSIHLEFTAQAGHRYYVLFNYYGLINTVFTNTGGYAVISPALTTSGTNIIFESGVPIHDTISNAGFFKIMAF